MDLEEKDAHREDQQQGAIFSYLSPEPRRPQDHPLCAIRTIADPVLTSCTRQMGGRHEEFGE
jgi:hypothetical protein